MTDELSTSRISSDESQASPALRKMVLAAQQSLPDASRVAAVAASLSAAVGVSAVASAAAAQASVATTATATSTKSAGALLWGHVMAKWIVAVGLATSAGAVTVWVTVSHSDAPSGLSSANSAQPLPTAPIPQQFAWDAPSEHVTGAPTGKPSASVVSTAFPGPRASSSAMNVEDEIRIIKDAQNALRVSPSRALALTEEHRRRVSKPMLAQEREVIAIEALVALGRRAEAQSRADVFARSYPQSAHRRRVDTILGERTSP